jgi:raffinose/stachyose/melibiose transport system substrate-binding protein
MKALFKAVAAAGIVAVALTGCGSSGTAQPAAAPAADLSNVKYEGSVSVITRYAGGNAAFFEKMAKDYEAAHPGVKVNLQQESDQGYKDKIKTLTASQSVPDVYFSWAGNYAEQFYDNGLALDLTNVIAPQTQWGSTMAPQALEAFTKDGKTYGVPLGLDAKYMLYNKKLFSQAGVTVPTDLDGLLAACTALKSKNITPMSFGNKDGWPAIHYITQLNSYNVPAGTLDKDYKPATASFEDPGYKQSLDQFARIVDQCTTTGRTANGADYYSERDAFGQGKAAMFYVENLEFAAAAPKGSKAEADGYDLFRLPAPAEAKGDTKALTGAPDGFLINSKAKNPALAVDFMKFVTSKQNAEVLASTIGFPSPVTGSLNEQNSTPQLRASIEDLRKASRLSVWLDTVTVPGVAEAYLSGVEGMISGTKTSEDVMTAVKAASDQAK